MEKFILDEVLTPEISVKIPSVEDEIKRVKHTISSFKTISKETINVVMPKGLDLKHGLNLNMSRSLTEQEYDPSFYTSGLERIKQATETIQQAVEVLAKYQNAWGFELNDSYQIILTRYGTGGSYDIKNKLVLVRTTADGQFERVDPAAVPIHEITHLCVEHLVEKYALTFSEKERLIGGIDSTLFPEIFDKQGLISEEERKHKLDMLKDLPNVVR